MVVTGKLASLRSEGTGDWGGTCGSSGDDNCGQGNGFGAFLCAGRLNFLVVSNLTAGAFSKGFRCTLLPLSSDPSVVLTTCERSSPISWFVAGTWLPARLDLVFEVRELICYHTVFVGCPVRSVVVLCGYQRLVSVRDFRCMANVCGNLCGSAAGQSTGVVQYVSIARYGSCPEASAFRKRFSTVWTNRSMNPLLCGYSGELVTWSMPQKATNS